MSDTKVFERADLLMFFGEDPETSAPIGTFNSIRKEGQGELFALARRTHQVRAITRVMFCEKLRFAVVEQNVHVSDAGRFVLPENHPYRDEALPRLTPLRGHVCHNSADLSREVVRIADEWRKEMRVHVPEGLIDTTKSPPI